MAKKTKTLLPDEPLRHPDHPRPITRRDFIRQGFISGTTAVTGGSALLSLLMQPQLAHANATTISSDIAGWASAAGCPVNAAGNLKIPFICFDLAGGANIAGSNVIVGGQGGQSDFISTAGYSKLGITAGSVPGQADSSGADNGDFTAYISGPNNPGLMFHSQSALLAGIRDTATAATLAQVDGFVIPAVSNNDTNTNPHNPMYGIAKAGMDGSTLDYGAKGSLLTLIGSVASVSGGNSMSPAGLIDPALQPTKISRPSDDIGLVNTGNLTGVLPTSADVVNVMEAVTRISHAAITNSGIRGSNSTLPQSLQDSLLCAYAKAADTANQFSSPSALDPTDPTTSPDIQTIFSKFTNGVSSDSEFLKTASVMKLVVNGYAGAGTITMGGYDYHTGNRTTGELRDLRAGRCIGACLEYARLRKRPLMIYVFSDGSLFSNGTPDPNAPKDPLGTVNLPGGKGVWTGDNSSTASVFALIYDPNAKPTLRASDRQLGSFKSTGSVNTSALTSSGLKIAGANDVTSLVYTLLLNYMALHGQQGDFDQVFLNQTLGTTNKTDLESLIMFNQLASVGSDGKIIVS